MRPSGVLCVIGAVVCSGSLAQAQPAQLAHLAWVVEDSRVRVLADGFIGTTAGGDDDSGGIAACGSFNDGALLEFPGAAFQSRFVEVDGGGVGSLSRAAVSMDGNVLGAVSHVTSRAGVDGSDASCLSAAFASTRIVGAVGLGSSESVVCVDVRFAVEVDLDGAALGDWMRVSVVSPDGATLGVAAGPGVVDDSGSALTQFGHLMGTVEPGAEVVIETLTPLADPATGATRRVDSRSIARLFTADLAEPFAVLGMEDVDAFIAGFVAGDCAFDFDGSGYVDLGDVDVFLSLFLGGSCPTAAVVRTGGADLTRPGAPCSL
ncbi:MAG: hypothetical protein AAF297_12510 [Planctomycetota bacterium]